MNTTPANRGQKVKGDKKSLEAEVERLTDENLRRLVSKLENGINSIKRDHNIIKTKLIRIENKLTGSISVAKAEVARFVYASDLSKFYLEHILFPLVQTEYQDFDLFTKKCYSDQTVVNLAWNTHGVDLISMSDLNQTRNNIVHHNNFFNRGSVPVVVSKLQCSLEEFMTKKEYDENQKKHIKDRAQGYFFRRLADTLCQLLKKYEPEPETELVSRPDNYD